MRGREVREVDGVLVKNGMPQALDEKGRRNRLDDGAKHEADDEAA